MLAGVDVNTDHHWSLLSSLRPPELVMSGTSYPSIPRHVNELTTCALPAQYTGRGPAKRIPLWLTIDVLVILLSLVIIGIGIWNAP